MITNNLGVRSALVSLSLVVFGAIGLAACAAPVAQDEEAVSAEQEQVGAAQEALGQCCYGYFTCPTTGHHYAWYTGPVSCGDSTEIYTVAATACNNACAPACVKTQTGCTPN